jgi:mRNA interferase MazF
MKRFLEWIGLKERLHIKVHRPPLVSEGDIWWASIGENVGSEINGKSALFSRPVIIIKKLSHSFYLVVPTTTKPRIGTWYVQFRHKEMENVACLHQVRSIDYRRISSKLGTLDDADLVRIKEGFKNLYI